MEMYFPQASFLTDALGQDIDIFTLHSSHKSSQVTPAMQPDLAPENSFRNPSRGNPWLKFQESLIRLCMYMFGNGTKLIYNI